MLRVRAKRVTKKGLEDASTLPELPERFYYSFESPTQHEVKHQELATLPERFYRATDPLEESVANETKRRRRLPRPFRRDS